MNGHEATKSCLYGMSDSKDDTGKENAPVVRDLVANAADTTLQSPRPTKSTVEAPQSSSPLLEVDQTLPQVSNLAPNSNGNHEETDEDNDSEAETLISSPVKKRESLKNDDASRLDCVNEEEPLPGNKVTGALSGVKIAPITNGRTVGNDDNASKEAEMMADAVKPTRAGDDDESDNLSEVSSLHSSSSDSASEGSSADAMTDGEGDDGEEGEVDERMENNRDDADHNHLPNPRKRKHRESYLQINMEPPRRRRRASDMGNGQDRQHSGHDSADASSSPQLRRHRRTTSAQFDWTEGGQNLNVVSASSSRQRRAATLLPNPEAKSRISTWDSDTSSETSQKHRHHQNRLIRNISRSISTPGRPMGRDHKRHVNRYGFTRLAEACESGELDQVKEWRDKDPEQLEQREFAGNTPLQVASLNGYPEIVTYLLEQGCNAHCANGDKDTPLIDAVENGHLEVVHLLLNAGVDPLRQNLKGQQALDVVTDKTENATEIRAALRKAIEDWTTTGRAERYQREEAPTHRPGPTKGLQFLARTYDNLLKLVSENDRTGVQEFLDARVPVDNAVVAAAAKTGDTFTVSMLLAEMTPKKARQRPEKPMLAVIGTSHFDMVKFLTGVDQFNPTWRQKSSGSTWYQLADQRRGPNWREEKELLQRLYDDHNNNNNDRLSSSPVHKRENGKKRRRSPARARDSDDEMNDADSPEQARNRRRLVSKKVMRATSNRRSSSTSSRDTARTDIDDSAMNSPDSVNTKPPAPRKVGRPRKTSLSSRLSEPQPKRQRSSSMREELSNFDPPPVSRLSTTKEDTESTKAGAEIKVEDVERQRIEDEAETSRQAELAAKLKAERLAEQSRKAAEVKAEELRKEEESRRRDAERKAEEIRKKHEQQLAEQRRAKEEAQIRALPSALQHVLGMTSAVKQEKQKYIQRHFLPVQVVKHADLGLTTDNGKADELWMLNYQAAAILTGASAADLLDLSADPATKQSSLSGIISMSTTEVHRRAMLLCLQSTSLVHALPSCQNTDDDLMAELAAAEKARKRVQEDRAKFMSMSALRWIRFSDFYRAAISLEHPHLSDLPLDMRFDCCLDPSPFTSEASARPPKTMTNGLSDSTTTASIESSPHTNGIHGKGLARAGPGITTFTVVKE